MTDLTTLVETKTAKVQNLIKGLKRHKELSGKQTKSITADILEAAIPLVRELVREENRAAFVLMLAERGLPKPGRKDNLCYHALKIAVGTEVTKRGETEGVWKWDKTLANYAPAVRNILTRDWKDDELAKRIREFEEKGAGRGLNGLQKADRIKHPSKKAEDEATSIKRVLRAQVTMTENDVAAIPADETVCLVWNRIVDGKLVPGGIVPDFALARKVVAQVGRDIIKGREEHAFGELEVVPGITSDEEAAA